ncbi:MAG: hypothetical protein H7844_09350 [Nitrospirae bacterium YQR-1]
MSFYKREKGSGFQIKLAMADNTKLQLEVNTGGWEKAAPPLTEDSPFRGDVKELLTKPTKLDD